MLKWLSLMLWGYELMNSSSKQYKGEYMNLLDNKILKVMIISASNQIQNNIEKINDMNVFPVPDGDTGTNMGLTFVAAANSVSELDDLATASEIFETLSKSALRNARGNSGVILSQILRGLWTGVGEAEYLDISALKNAMCSARDTAYRAVMKPTEGTILTVVREIAEFAEQHFVEHDEISQFLNAVYDAGTVSLMNTPEILPVLKQAGVVDAGGCGIMTLLHGAVSGLRAGEAVKLQDENSMSIKGSTKSSAALSNSTIDTANIKFKYCTEFLINKKGDRGTAQFMAAIKPKGDCMLVIDDDDIVKVHIHTNNPGFVLEQAIKLGELTNLKIDNMKYQHSENIDDLKSESGDKPDNDAENGKIIEFSKNSDSKKEYGFVSVVSGDGMRDLFDSLECDYIVEGGQTMNPSTQDLLDAVESVDAKNVFVLPNNKNIILAAEQVNDLTDSNVIVIATKNMPQGISAIASFNQDAEIDENIEMMKEMVSMVKCGQITYAARSTRMNGFDIHEGDVMGVIGSDVSMVGIEMEDVCIQLAEKLIDDDSAVISLYYGEDIDKEKAKKVADKLTDKFGDLDVNINYGGQAVYYYLIAVE